MHATAGPDWAGAGLPGSLLIAPMLDLWLRRSTLVGALPAQESARAAVANAVADAVPLTAARIKAVLEPA